VTKERRLGRGLEALLGQLPVRRDTAPAAPAARTSAEDAAETVSIALPLSGRGESASFTSPETAPAKESGAIPFGGASRAPAAESLFRLDVPHAPPGQLHAEPHRAPAESRPSVPATAETSPPTPPENQLAAATNPTRVHIRQIDHNPAQPRQEFDPDDMRALAESIAAHGLLQPVVVRRSGERFQLVAGERRLRAAIQAGWELVPVNVVEANDRQMAELAIVENLQRKDLNALEKAASFQKYLDQYGCTQEELAGRLKLDRSTIANLIRLLELPEAVQDALRRGKITPAHARALLPLGDEREQIEFCARIQREGLNVRQTESMVQEMIEAADSDPLTASAPPRSVRARKNEHIAVLEQQFHAALGLKVHLSHNARGRGKLVVHFRNHEEFERLQRHICGN